MNDDEDDDDDENDIDDIENRVYWLFTELLAKWVPLWSNDMLKQSENMWSLIKHPDFIIIFLT